MKDDLRQAFVEAAIALQQGAEAHYERARHGPRELARQHQEEGAALSAGARLLVRKLIA
jgi:hypothetical protein